MWNAAQQRGYDAEDKAARYLVSKGYEIRARSYKNIYGEIDILAQKEDWLVFVEVKMRVVADEEVPFEAVDERKQRKLVKTALGYLQELDLMEHNCRFDVIGVRSVDQEVFIDHIEDAFQAGMSLF